MGCGRKNKGRKEKGLDHRISKVSFRGTKVKVQGFSGTLFLTWNVCDTCRFSPSSEAAVKFKRRQLLPAVGEAPGSSEPGRPHLSRGSRATAPPAPAAAAGLSLVPRRRRRGLWGNSAGAARWRGMGETETRLGCGARRPGRARLDGRDRDGAGRRCSQARPGSARDAAPGARPGTSGLRLERRHKVCEHPGGAARTCRFIAGRGTATARDVKACAGDSKEED
ncbi:uncharacterized protein LOC124236800 [Equus quagga]|uniref:uncharacterized protein LOC124236800 n=1 Tax=Equus quagga TaxID=89248 RepID=UPI001EE229FF|nr:uncharacterized protein LOC124236800 [Equus quagga]